MGIYWAVVNYSKKEIVHPAKESANKMPAIVHPENSFGRMVLLLLQYKWNGDEIALIPDSDDTYYDNEYKDVSQNVLDEWQDSYGKMDVDYASWFPKE